MTALNVYALPNPVVVLFSVSSDSHLQHSRHLIFARVGWIFLIWKSLGCQKAQTEMFELQMENDWDCWFSNNNTKI